MRACLATGGRGGAGRGGTGRDGAEECVGFKQNTERVTRAPELHSQAFRRLVFSARRSRGSGRNGQDTMSSSHTYSGPTSIQAMTLYRGRVTANSPVSVREPENETLVA
ncbi:hypothetical protein E2C01_075911 [Portunus trituberculatus]|uniref:Uncharacterized protein n=1 Tax=Portunus trituberculatus TaxID=210409 RepID=A0A5B7ILT8_PORTR|nr:hypothetical protein [Portunus trituberculatus]